MTKRKETNFFDLRYFKYLFKDILRKWSIYVFAFIYFILIASYSIIVPIIAKTTAYEIYSYPISIIFLVFSVGLISIAISIEVFKSSIDDGSELLILSKTFTRQEISIVKISIFFTITLIIASCGSLISLFSLLSKPGIGIDYLLLSLGIFLGTIIVSLLFGGITTIFSMFISRTKSFISSIVFLLVLVLYSILSMFITKSYINELDSQNIVLSKSSFVDPKKEDKNSNYVQGYWLNDVDRAKYDLPTNIESIDIIKDVINYSSKYNIIHYTNICSQLARIFTFGQMTSDLYKLNDVVKVFNIPFSLELSSGKVEDFFNNPIKISLGIFNDYNQISDLELKNEINKFNTITYLLPQMTYGTYLEQLHHDGQNYVEINQIFERIVSTGDIVFNEYSSSLWDTTWNKYKKHTEDAINNSFQNYSPYSYFLKKWIEDQSQNITNPNQVKNILNNFQNLLKSIVYKLTFDFQNGINIFNLINVYKEVYEVDEKNNIVFDTNTRIGNIFNIDGNTKLASYLKDKLIKIYPNVKNSTKLSTILEEIKLNHKDIYNWILEQNKDWLEINIMLGLLGVSVDKWLMLTTGAQIANHWNPNNIPFNFQTLLSTFNSKNDSNINHTKDLIIKQPLVLRSNLGFDSFTRVKIKSFYNQTAISIGWTVVAFCIFIVSMIIYSKKDFK